MMAITVQEAATDMARRKPLRRTSLELASVASAGKNAANPFFLSLSSAFLAIRLILLV
jgi:hypothetical protein